ncbi:hypothetical protein QCA50_002737 [Cerrena zonata]|uniref:Tetraspanin n=1 Tax=Cerrena zonata TaxID=2478898 RepID=A0AAW0GIJ3_9APHY
MVSKKLLGCWAFVDIWLLAAGILSLVLSIVWKAPNLMLNFTLSRNDLTGESPVIPVHHNLLTLYPYSRNCIGHNATNDLRPSIFAIVQRNHVTIGLVLLNWMLIADSIAILVIGVYVWFFTLKMRNNFHQVWLDTTPDVRSQIQDKFSCCGYFFANDTTEFTGFCRDPAFVATLQNDSAIDQNRCVAPITSFTDMTLNNIFTCMFGFMAIVICLFLASVCVINKRMEAERFKRIDAKRGGRGFV